MTNINDMKPSSSKALSPKDQMKDLLVANRDFIADLLPKHMTEERMLRLAISMYSTVPKLAECSVASVLGAVVHCASIGLEPNTPLGHAYIIPFNNGKTKRMEAQVIHGYKGLADLMYRSGNIKNIHADVVHAGDIFDWEHGSSQFLRHRPQGRGAPTHFYAYYHTVNGGFECVVMPKHEVDKIMTGTQSKGAYGPWKDHYEEMGKKTCIRRISKTAQLSIEANRAFGMESLAEMGQSQHLETVLKGDTFEVVEPITTTAPEKSKPDPATPAAADTKNPDPETRTQEVIKKPAATRKPRTQRGPEPMNLEMTENGLIGGDKTPFDDAPSVGKPEVQQYFSFESFVNQLGEAKNEDDLVVVEDLIRSLPKNMQGIAEGELAKARAGTQTTSQSME